MKLYQSYRASKFYDNVSSRQTAKSELLVFLSTWELGPFCFGRNVLHRKHAAAFFCRSNIPQRICIRSR